MKSAQEKLTDELVAYIRLRLGMALFPVRRLLLNMDREELANLVTSQAEGIGYGIRELIETHFPRQ
jgi:hypothetical protein